MWAVFKEDTKITKSHKTMWEAIMEAYEIGKNNPELYGPIAGNGGASLLPEFQIRSINEE